MAKQPWRYLMSVRLAAALFLSLTIALPLLAFSSAPAAAQEERARPRTLFGLLFGGEAKAIRRNSDRSAKRSRARQPGGSDLASRAPKPEVVEKLENARVVLVVGDFLADGLAEGLQSAYAASPGVQIISETNGSSGFVRDDFHDWPGQITSILDETKPAIVIVMAGSNDRQQLLVDGNREKVRSEAWSAEYTKRTERMAKQIRDRGLPLFWVGMPPFKAGSMTADMLAFNDIYRSVAESVGGEFIDIWDGFVDENGAFSSVGPDMNGQRVQLRGSDGINMTGAGKRKIAFYAERPLNRILGNAVSPGIAALGAQDLPSLMIEPSDVPDIVRTTPVALSDPEMDGSIDLLGASKMTRPREARSPVEQLSLDGIAPPAQAGRADDFSSPPGTEPIVQATDKSETTTAISE